MEYVKINNQEYPAEISGLNNDYSWDNRESKTITFTDVLTRDEVDELFCEGAVWSIISEWTETVVNPETGEEETITHRDEFDNSDFSMAGAITDYRDGRVSVKMGKLNDLEELIENIFGGDL